MTDYVCVYIQHADRTEHGGIIGTAASEDEALNVARAAGHRPTGEVRWYDADQGPVVAGYQGYGEGVFVVDASPPA